jgi:hypothetical protein
MSPQLIENSTGSNQSNISCNVQTPQIRQTKYTTTYTKTKTLNIIHRVKIPTLYQSSASVTLATLAILDAEPSCISVITASGFTPTGDFLYC